MESRLSAFIHEYKGYDSVLLCYFTRVSDELAASTFRVVEEEQVCGNDWFQL